jgi:uncharacterized phage protein (TIGR01671 family)
MDRIIKFRYWDGCEIIKWDNFFFSDMSAVTDYSGDFSYIEQDKLMQFTGLIDINGKEIYEGDIINSFQNDYMPTEIYWDNELCCYSVQTYHATLQLIDAIDTQTEIIGNIFENPELIK